MISLKVQERTRLEKILSEERATTSKILDTHAAQVKEMTVAYETLQHSHHVSAKAKVEISESIPVSVVTHSPG